MLCGQNPRQQLRHVKLTCILPTPSIKGGSFHSSQSGHLASISVLLLLVVFLLLLGNFRIFHYLAKLV